MQEMEMLLPSWERCMLMALASKEYALSELYAFHFFHFFIFGFFYILIYYVGFALLSFVSPLLLWDQYHVSLPSNTPHLLFSCGAIYFLTVVLCFDRTITCAIVSLGAAFDFSLKEQCNCDQLFSKGSRTFEPSGTESSCCDASSWY